MPSRWLSLLALFAVLALLCTYPVWTAPHRLVLDEGDGPFTAWVMAWDAHAVADPEARLFDANLFHPRDGALALSENLLGNALLVAPINWAGQPVLAYNVALLLAFFLTGVAAAGWVRELCRSDLAGVVAGIVCAVAPARVDHLGHLQLLSTQWALFGLWMLTRYLRTGRRRDLIAGAAFLGWQYLTGIQVSLLLFPFVGLYFLALWRLSGGPAGRNARQLAVDVGLATIAFTVLVVPVSLPYLQQAEQGFTRPLAASLEYSARPSSLLAASAVGRAPHMRYLSDRYGSAEANLLPGVVALGLFGFALAGSRLGRRRQEPDSAPLVAQAPFIGSLHSTARVASFGLLGGIAAVGILAVWPGDSAVRSIAATFGVMQPATLLGATMLVALFTAPRRPRHRALAPICLVLALLAFLFAMGPEITVSGVSLGWGPFALLHEFATPYQSVRAVGRFGLAMLIWVAAGAGLGAMLLRKRLAGRSPAAAAAFGVALTGALVAEYWVAPAQTYDIRSPDEAAYQRIGSLPGRGAVLHLPVFPTSTRASATRYLLGSTRHWRPLANGYSGFLPFELESLVPIAIFTEEFYDAVRTRFDVDHLIVHERYLDRTTVDGLEARLAADRRNIASVERVGEVLIASLRRDRGTGAIVHRRFGSDQMAGRERLRFHARSQVPGARLEVAWNDRVYATVELTADWSESSVELPTDLAPRPDGGYRLSLAGVPPGLDGEPFGGSPAPTIRADLLVDAQPSRSGVAVNDVWHTMLREPGFLIVGFSADGRRVETVRRIPATAGAAARAAGLVGSMLPGTLVGVAMDLPHTRRGSDFDQFRVAMQAVGAMGPDRTDERYGAIGVTGAAPGSAVERGGRARGVARVGISQEKRPTVSIRRLELRPQG